jgi:predicted XRE-type DNA-binding protein
VLTMKKEKIRNLERKGWKVGTASDFLNLSREEEEYIELKLALSNYFQKLRKKKHLTQMQVAETIKSSQSRVAKIERAEASVSLDLIVRSLIALGSSKKDIGKVMLAKTA